MKLLSIKLLIVAVLMFAATSAFADFSYNFNVDTSSLNGQAGYMDLQFNPGISNAIASATVTNFISDATLGAVITSGTVTGMLPSTVTINNNTGFNDYFQAVTFGNTANFALNLSGAAGSSFALAFLDSTQTTPLLTNDQVNGIATRIDVTPNGPVVTNNSNQVTATPIPAAAYLFGSGLMGLVGIRRKIKN